LKNLSVRAQREALEACLREEARRRERRKLRQYNPYDKQAAFHEAGRMHRERLLMAGNQLGKTFSGAAEAAIHLTGLYPDWWKGRVFNGPVRAWVASKTSEVTRDCPQRILIGEPKLEEAWGTAMLPGECIVDYARRRGVADSIDSVAVRHVSGGISSLGFKSYDQGREKWQGETLHFVWFDEEPPYDIYMEGLTRTNATGGMVYLTFTPLLGMSDVVSLFVGGEEMSSGAVDLQRAV